MVAWVSKAYYAPAPVIRQLKSVYHVTMGTKGWGITLPILSRPRLQGGLALPEPELFLMHRAAALFVSLLGEPRKYPNKSVETFYAWEASIGFTPSKDNLRYIHIYPTGHGSTSGTNVPGMVGEGTLIYPTGGPAGAPPDKPGPITDVAIRLLPE